MRTNIIVLGLVVTIAVAGSAQAEEPTVDYVVQEGDTCLGVAIRVVGDRTAYKRIHALNPDLGPLPHVLVAGQVIRIPAPAAPDGPDAKLTAVRGDVKVRRPAEAAWDPAARGMELFRAWRVGSYTDASAELTFRDAAHLRLREQTIVILYGPEKRRAKVVALEAELEEGTLETRLGELGGSRAVVRTPDAEAEVGDGRALVTVDGKGDSIVANHDGAPVKVRGTNKKKKTKTKAVSVASGMGSKVKKGKAPDRPRPLPPAPAWITTPQTFVALAAGTGRIVAEWAAVATAVRYRVTVTDAAAEEIAAVEVAAPATRVEIPQPGGQYRVVVAAIDGDGFESRPSTDLSLGVASVGVVPPGASAPLGVTSPADHAIPVLALGTELLGPTGSSCAIDGGVAANPLVLAAAGTVTVTCVDGNGGAFEPFQIEVAPVTVRATDGSVIQLRRGAITTLELTVESAGPLGAALEATASRGVAVTEVVGRDGGLTIVVAAAMDAPDTAEIVVRAAGLAIATWSVTIVGEPEAVTVRSRDRAARAELGLFLGGHAFVGGDVALDLGQPSDPGDDLRSGPSGGIRAGYFVSPRLAVEGELGLIPTGSIMAPQTALVGSARAHVAFVTRRGRVGVRVLGGVGLHALVAAPPGRERDAAPFVDWGVALTTPLGGAVSLRLDARDELGRSAEGISHGFEVGLGVSIELGRD